MRNRVGRYVPLFQGIVLGVLTLVAAASFVALSDLRFERAEFALSVQPPQAPSMVGAVHRIDAALQLNNELKRRASACAREQLALRRWMLSGQR